MKTVTLNNGVEMPLLGLGVFRITDPVMCENTVIQAIRDGYRLIDTAEMYGNEEAVGRGIRRAGVRRQDLFITSKVWITHTTYEGTKQAFQDSLKRLGVDYLDLYVIHQPFNDYYGAWRALEELYQAGKVRAIGVDNFSQAQVVDLINFNQIKPMVDYIEMHPFYQQEAEQKALKGLGVQPVAWSPFAAGQFNLFKEPILSRLAQQHSATAGQVILRWLQQRQIVTVAKSVKPARLQENFESLNLKLSNEEMAQIATLDKGLVASLAGDRSQAKVLQEFLNVAKKG